MRVGLEAAAGRDGVIVADQQEPVMGVVGSAVWSKRERVVRIQPIDVRSEAAVGAPDVDSLGLLPARLILLFCSLTLRHGRSLLYHPVPESAAKRRS
jgi:hypothetical protein